MIFIRVVLPLPFAPTNPIRDVYKRQHTCRLESVIYEHGTHFVFPESMLKTMLPVGSGLFVKLAFQAARKYPVSYTHLDVYKRQI